MTPYPSFERDLALDHVSRGERGIVRYDTRRGLPAAGISSSDDDVIELDVQRSARGVGWPSEPVAKAFDVG